MFVPPYEALAKALGLTREDFHEESNVTIPAAVLRLLLENLLQQTEFDEEHYLALNPDVARAVADGTVSSARHHYVLFGYWESRPGATASVDEDWYVGTNADVAAAIKAGSVASGAQHYLDHGREEFRAPNPAAIKDCQQWQAILGASVAEAGIPDKQQTQRR